VYIATPDISAPASAAAIGFMSSPPGLLPVGIPINMPPKLMRISIDISVNYRLEARLAATALSSRWLNRIEIPIRDATLPK
jgi:hypothetical protein